MLSATYKAARLRSYKVKCLLSWGLGLSSGIVMPPECLIHNLFKWPTYVGEVIAVAIWQGARIKPENELLIDAVLIRNQSIKNTKMSVCMWKGCSVTERWKSRYLDLFDVFAFLLPDTTVTNFFRLPWNMSRTISCWVFCLTYSFFFHLDFNLL